MADPELIERLKVGDEAAFRAMVAEYGGRLARLARSFTRNDSVIEEAVQEYLARRHPRRSRLQGRAPFRAWIFAILVNQARRLAVREHRHTAIPVRAAPAADPSWDVEEPEDREPGMGKNGMWVTPPHPGTSRTRRRSS